jgi:predicted NAD/FAD-binding protein
MGLLSELGIDGQKTQMSFSVHNPASGLEYNGHTLTSLFAQRVPDESGILGNAERDRPL